MDRQAVRGLRHDWKFQYPVSAILEAARAKADYHDLRLNYWRNKFTEAVDALKAGGLEIRERPVTGGVDVEAVIDPERRFWLSKCQAKIAAHRAAREDYTRFARALERTLASGTLELDADDVAFFFGPEEDDTFQPS